MAYIYPTKKDLKTFVSVIRKGNYPINRYLPSVDEEWYSLVGDCIEYVAGTAKYQESDFYTSCAQLLYKVVKRHEFGDGNKRSSVIAVFLFCILNNYSVINPALLKQQARRVAKTKGRINEEVLKRRIAIKLAKEIK